jgi:hypothetical protein
MAFGMRVGIAMGFGEYDGTLDNAEKRLGEFAGWRYHWNPQ